MRTELDRRHRRRRRNGDVSRTATVPRGQPLGVGVFDPADAIASRLDRLGAAAALHVADLEVPTGGGQAGVPDGVAVAVVVVRDGDPEAVLDLRRLHRTRPDLRLVVAGEGTGHFEAAFDAGADAWISVDADDRTLVAAIRGPHP